MSQKEIVSAYVPKFVLAFCLIVSFSVLVGSMFYLLKNKSRNIPAANTLSISTDKTEYLKGEEVKINIANAENEMFLTFPSIEVFEPADENLGGGQWKTIRTVWSGCGVVGGLPYLPLSPGEPSVYSWDQKEKWCAGGSADDLNIQEAEAGKYRVKGAIVLRTRSKEEDPNNISGQLTSDFVYSNEFTIKEKTAIDSKCNQKVNIIAGCYGENVVAGFEFDSNTAKCITKYFISDPSLQYIKTSGYCRAETPFNTLEECQSVCETKTDFYSCSADSDCVPVRADCCGCNAGGKATAINSKFIFEWNDKCKKTEPVMCPAVMSNDPSCFGTVKCVNNICEMINPEK